VGDKVTCFGCLAGTAEPPLPWERGRLARIGPAQLALALP